jgi:membrane protein required for beta-lactamase induction
MLQSVGRASLDQDQAAFDSADDPGALAERQIDDTASLLFRSAAAWVVVIALLVLLT